VGLVSRQ